MAAKYEKIQIIGGHKVLKYDGDKRKGCFLKDEKGNTKCFLSIEEIDAAIEADKPKKKATKKSDK
jgi:hypothetical protein